jgi:hypothetical protein
VIVEGDEDSWAVLRQLKLDGDFSRLDGLLRNNLKEPVDDGGYARWGLLAQKISRCARAQQIKEQRHSGLKVNSAWQ